MSFFNGSCLLNMGHTENVVSPLNKQFSQWVITVINSVTRWILITTAAQDRLVLYLNCPKRHSCSVLHSGQCHEKNWRPYITGVEGLTDPNLKSGMTKMLHWLVLGILASFNPVCRW